MFDRCHNCSHLNPVAAQFCGRCGACLVTALPRRLAPKPLPPIPAPQPVARKGTGCGTFVVIILLIVVTGVWVFRQVPSRTHRSHSFQQERIFVLSRSKANAMFALLAPDDVRVVVDLRSRGIYIRGTSQEVRAIACFVELLSTFKGRWDDDRTSWPDPCDPELFEHTYALSKSKARSLQKALSFTGVPVCTSRHGSRLVIIATAEDHETIERMVRILGGKPLR